MRVTFSEFCYSNLPEEPYEMTSEEVTERLAKRYGEYAEEMSELFAKAYPEKPLYELLAMDSYFGMPNIKFLDAKAAQSSAPTYSYMFSYTFPLYGGSPAWHCSEIPYIYHSTHKVPVCGEPVVREQLEAQLCTAFTNFAKCGNPNCDLLPQWEPYTNGNEVTMVFDRKCDTRVDFNRELIELHFKALKGGR